MRCFGFFVFVAVWIGCGLVLDFLIIPALPDLSNPVIMAWGALTYMVSRETEGLFK